MPRTGLLVRDDILRLHAAGRSLRAIQKLLAERGIAVSRGTIANVCRRGPTPATIEVLTGDCREVLATLPGASVQCVVTSPPYYGLRDYRHAGQIGREATPQEYIDTLVEVFRQVRRVLRRDGTLWLNIGDTYNTRSRVRPSSHQPSLNGVVDASWAGAAANGEVRMPTRRDGLKEKDQIGIPWRVAFALQRDGWYLRQSVIWHKPGPVPESVRDRPTSAYEMVFLLSRSPHYYYDGAAIAEPSVRAGSMPSGRKHTSPGFDGRRHGPSLSAPIRDTRNRRNVWTIPTAQTSCCGHYATMPLALAELCIRAGSRPDDVVLDPFGGAGTTAVAARGLGRRAILVELRASFVAIARERTGAAGGRTPATEGYDKRATTSTKAPPPTKG